LYLKNIGESIVKIIQFKTVILLKESEIDVKKVVQKYVEGISSSY